MSKQDQMIDQFGQEHSGTEVDVIKITPGQTMVELGDGTILSLSVFPLAVQRLDGAVDQQGLPIYAVRNQVATLVHQRRDTLTGGTN